jgi:isopenicillin N synthase-like dioxygenase
MMYVCSFRSSRVTKLVLQLLRYMIYDPLTSAEALTTNGVMLNGHTDFNSISTLVSQPISALQILMPDGVWRYVKHKDDALVINIGDQLSWVKLKLTFIQRL